MIDQAGVAQLVEHLICNHPWVAAPNFTRVRVANYPIGPGLKIYRIDLSKKQSTLNVSRDVIGQAI